MTIDVLSRQEVVYLYLPDNPPEGLTPEYWPGIHQHSHTNTQVEMILKTTIKEHLKVS